MSDVVATTPTVEGAAGQEAAFQSFWDTAEAAERPREEEAAQTQQNDAQDVREAQGDEQTTETPEAKEGAENEAPTYSSLNEMLAAHKIDHESVMGLHVTAKIDGKETQVSLSDVLKSYQLEGHVNNKSIELSNQRAQHEQERNEWRQANQTAIQQHQAMANVALQMLNHDFNRVDWNALRVQNPAEFAALQAEYGQRQQQIQGFLQQVTYQQQQQEAQQQQVQQQSLAQERQKLLDAVPEWRDNATFGKDREAISQYARNLGFQDAELNQIFDHRYMRILHDAARYQALQAAKPEALKQVRQAPPMAKPGSRVDSNPSAAKRQQVMDRLNRNPRDQDAQAAAFDFFAQ